MRADRRADHSRAVFSSKNLNNKNHKPLDFVPNTDRLISIKILSDGERKQLFKSMRLSMILKPLCYKKCISDPHRKEAKRVRFVEETVECSFHPHPNPRPSRKHQWAKPADIPETKLVSLIPVNVSLSLVRAAFKSYPVKEASGHRKLQIQGFHGA